MTKIRGNEDYLCRAKCVNIFDIVSCKEEQASEILAWLLDPAQGHGLKEYFLKRLLNFLSVGGKIDCFKGKKASSVACKEILKKEILQNIVVQTEVALKNDQRCRNSLAPKDDKCKRVDVFLCADKNRKDADCNGYMLVLENKYGSAEHGEQTRYYFNYMSKKYPEYKIIYLYMDYYLDFDYIAPTEFSEISDKGGHWHACNYVWLTEALFPKIVADKILADIYFEFSQDHEHNKYFQPFYRQRRELKKHFAEELERYNKIPQYYQPGHTEDIVYYRYLYFFDELAAYPRCAEYVEEIRKNKKYSEYKYEAKEKSFFVTTRRAVELQQKFSQKYWPYNIYVHQTGGKWSMDLVFNRNYLKQEQYEKFDMKMRECFQKQNKNHCGWLNVGQHPLGVSELKIDGEFKKTFRACLVELKTLEEIMTSFIK